MATIVESGKLIHKSEIKSGTSQRGNTWASMDIVLEIPTYQNSFKHLAFRVSTNEVNDVNALAIGTQMKVNFGISSREWNGKWFTTAELVSFEVIGGQPVAAPAPAPQSGSLDPNEVNDLPF